MSSSQASAAPTPDPSPASLAIPTLPLFQRALSHASSPAITSNGSTHSYAQLLLDASAFRLRLLSLLPSSSSPSSPDLSEARIVFLVPPSYAHVVVAWGVQMAGGVTVPLHPGHADPEMAYIAEDSGAVAAVVHPAYASRLAPIAERLHIPLITLPPDTPTPSPSPSPLPTPVSVPLLPSRRANLIYTSGSTGRPKGVVSTHAMLEAQITALTEAWKWTPSDHILHVLPLHHIHGYVNVLLCPLWVGAQVTFLEGKFEPRKVWEAFERLPLTLFMAVPTIYSRLIAAYNAASEDEQRRWSAACHKFRLMVSGSAALPTPVLQRWKAISGHTLLERMGMTETGMILSNPLRGTRKEGYVGRPLPGVSIRVRPQEGEGEGEGEKGEGGKVGGEADDGELLVKGACVFREYHGKPEATAAAFDADGWFLTGDIVSRDSDGDYRIVGRASVDVLKSAGYKLSALEIERDMLAHEGVEEVAVVGIPDEEYGQVVGAVVVVKKGGGGEQLTGAQLQEWCKTQMSREKVPRVIKLVDEIPRNAMGKVNKKTLLVECFPNGTKEKA